MEVYMEITREVNKLILNCKRKQTKSHLQQLIELKENFKIKVLKKISVIRKFPITANDDNYFNYSYNKTAIEQGLLKMTIPEKRNSRNQKYRMTDKGLVFRKELEL